MSLKIKLFDYRNAADFEYKAYNDCRNQIRAERLPDDPPIPLEEAIQGFKNFPDYIDLSLWVAWDERETSIMAYAMARLPQEDNLQLAQFVINVLPEFRRQGLGREFLSRIADVAAREKRKILIAGTIARIPAGEAFMERIGAERGLETHTNQLMMADLDGKSLDQWINKASERAAGFEIGFWEGEYPEGDIDAIVDLYDLLNQQPFGDLAIEDFTFTAEQLRQDEQSIFSRGYERWTLYVREKETGKFAGYTEVLWNQNRPKIIIQDMTGVFPEYRNKGLGRWLKAAMLVKILAERKEAVFVRTENADMNAPMLKINTELGFKPYIAESVWQVETSRVSEYLAE